jgi:bifunctional UDP-N-acetylglucosamine pyrophosphorylase / glucosamine-1-phosphate N-acetyltransferase
MSTRKCAAIVLAAGQGKRMKSSLPKVLHKICGLPIIQHIVDALERVPVAKQVVVIGHRHDLVRAALKGNGVDLVLQTQQLGTAHAVACAKGKFRGFLGDVLVVAGDVPLLSVATLRGFIRVHRALRSKATVLTTTISEPKAYGRIVRDGTGCIRKIVEELDANADERAIREINSGIYLFDAQMLFGKVVRIKRNSRKKEFYLTDIVEALMHDKVEVHAYHVNNADEVRGINSRKDLSDLNTIMNRGTLCSLQKSGVTVLSEDNTFVEARVKVGRDTIIYPFTYIEKDVTVGKGCVIGPFCKIRKGTRIKNNATIGSFVEINRSTIGDRVTIKHLSYIGDTTIGADANIGAGTITANYDGKNKHKTVIKEKALIGANTVLVAPVTVGRSARTGAGSVVRAGQNIPAYKLAVGVPAKIIK